MISEDNKTISQLRALLALEYIHPADRKEELKSLKYRTSNHIDYCAILHRFEKENIRLYRKIFDTFGKERLLRFKDYINSNLDHPRGLWRLVHDPDGDSRNLLNSLPDSREEIYGFTQETDCRGIHHQFQDIPYLHFYDCNLMNVKFDNSSIWRSSFQHSLLGRSSFQHASIVNASFVNCSCHHADFSNSMLTNCFFSKEDSNRGDFRHANFQGAWIQAGLSRGSCFDNADFRGARIECKIDEETTFRGADFRGADLSGVSGKTCFDSFEEARFEGAIPPDPENLTLS